MSRWHYFIHLMGWATPVILLQWALAHRAFRRNLRAVIAPALIGGTFFSIIDSVAVHAGVWFFDPAQILGVFVGPLPLEEVLFFYVTSLLVSQSLVMFLPDGWRR